MWNLSLQLIREIKIQNVLCSFCSWFSLRFFDIVVLRRGLTKTISNTSLHENDQLEPTNSLHDLENKTDKIRLKSKKYVIVSYIFTLK